VIVIKGLRDIFGVSSYHSWKGLIHQASNIIRLLSDCFLLLYMWL